MAGVHRVVEIHAGQDREDIGLQRGDQKLKSSQRHDHRHRQNGAEITDRAHGTEGEDEAGEDFERDVTREHVREKTDGVADRARKVGNHFDRDHERQEDDRHTRRHEKAEKLEAVEVDARERHAEEHGDRQREGDDDVARGGEGVGEEADHIRAEDEHEEREDEGEEADRLVAGIVADHVVDELVEHLGGGLEATGNHRLAAHRQNREGGHDTGCHHHPEARIGEGGVIAPDLQRNDLVDHELVQRIDGETTRVFGFCCHGA